MKFLETIKHKFTSLKKIITMNQKSKQFRKTLRLNHFKEKATFQKTFVYVTQQTEKYI